jgi:hypothetical protein
MLSSANMADDEIEGAVTWGVSAARWFSSWFSISFLQKGFD